MEPARTDGDASQHYDVELLGVGKTFGGVDAVRDVTLRVTHGTFFSLLGPSGCGKTTTLRLIAGFEQPTSGRIAIGGQDVAGLPPYRRDCNTVFQSYALFPHMSVFDNIAYALRQKRLEKGEIARRVESALAMVRLPGAGKRRPAELSGGQQQRVALARALVNRPTVLLLDEPLSALDLKLRKEMQGELKALQRAVGITFIYVTHDQEEAITLSDQVAVMHGGRIEQEDTPEQIYQRPQTRFVADFIGLTNFVEGTVHAAVEASPGDAQVTVATPIGQIVCGGYQPRVLVGERVTLTLRPERIWLLPAEVETPAGWNTAEGVVVQATYMGPQSEYQVALGSTADPTLTVRRQNSGASAADRADGDDINATGTDTATERHAFGAGERVTLAWRREASLILRESGGEARESAREGGMPRPTPTSQAAKV
jgi:spermidine/putrescine transport system ATP-binding protein